MSALPTPRPPAPLPTTPTRLTPGRLIVWARHRAERLRDVADRAAQVDPNHVTVRSNRQDAHNLDDLATALEGYLRQGQPEGLPVWWPKLGGAE